jgi:hypothetical protein
MPLMGSAVRFYISKRDDANAKTCFMTVCFSAESKRPATFVASRWK